MIKASNTVWTYMWSVPLGLTVWNNEKALNLAVIGAGVAVRGREGGREGGREREIAFQMQGWGGWRLKDAVCIANID